MCGVIGLIFQKDKDDLGQVAGKLLKMLEYRGYDSTGAVVQDSDDRITLRKDVGAPSDLVSGLGIDALTGRIFCGQVRWATFGAVNKENAQPHEMRCKIHVYGAHNGNITNCQQLKDWLIGEGHDVKSDNDGEMLVHTVEHFFAEELQYKNADDHAVREKALRTAALRAAKKLVGSYAAVVVDPVSKIVLAIKAGSSFYLGLGHEAAGGDFVIGSSDLASVLQMTRILLPIREKEFAVFTADSWTLYDLRNGRKLNRTPLRSLLKVEETSLQPPYKFFMEQEIHHQVETTRRVKTRFTGGGPATQILRRHLKTHGAAYTAIREAIRRMADLTDPQALATEARQFFAGKLCKPLRDLIPADPLEGLDLRPESSFGGFLDELRDLVPVEPTNVRLFLKFIDAVFELEEVEDIEARIRKFLALVNKARRGGSTIYILACGTSFHAAKTAPLFFNEIAGLPVIPLLPGEFRAQCTNSLRDGDLVIGISQSGETKDLIDVFNFIAASKKSVKRVCLLNNTNSSLALEKSDLYIPLYCGPEIAVPATKSFINQLMALYILAVRVREQEVGARRQGRDPEIARHYADLDRVPGLIDKTLKTTQKEIDEIATELFLTPSIHILATRLLGIAKEGALKVRETVLNHTEGYEGSEFKHGPNTILGLNTVFGMDGIRAILNKFCDAILSVAEHPEGKDLDAYHLHRIFRAVAEFAFNDIPPRHLNNLELGLFKDIFSRHNFFASMYQNYPLIFISCPHETDINLTISQINTHKIRGANVFMIAEDNDRLREAVSIAPAGPYQYRHGYITLPRTDHALLPVFSISTVLQLLALRMSQKKLEFLDRLEIENHGVHPDSPKNVSKSITVD